MATSEPRKEVAVEAALVSSVVAVETCAAALEALRMDTAGNKTPVSTVNNNLVFALLLWWRPMT